MFEGGCLIECDDKWKRRKRMSKRRRKIRIKKGGELFRKYNEEMRKFVRVAGMAFYDTLGE